MRQRHLRGGETQENASWSGGIELVGRKGRCVLAVLAVLAVLVFGRKKGEILF